MCIDKNYDAANIDITIYTIWFKYGFMRYWQNVCG